MILFFDDQPLLARDNMTRRYSNPEYMEESYYRDANNYSISAGLPSVFFDEKRNEYIMIYNVLEPAGRNNELYMLAAHSNDCVHWESLDTTEVKFEDRRFFNQATPFLFGEGIVYKDERAPKEERYKLLYCRYAENLRVKNEIYVSPDYLHWTKLDAMWNPEGAEPGLGVFYSSVRKKYVITCRPHWAERRVCVTETEDWRTFTPIVLCAQSDSIDEPLSVIYGMPVTPYGNYYIGLLWKLRECEQLSLEQGNQLCSTYGRMYPELSYSLNGISFQRSLREPFISNGTPDKPYYGCLFTQTMIPVNDDIYFYAACSHGEHGDFRVEGTGAIVGFKTKKDRFIFLESNGVGRVLTRNLLIKGELSVNAQVVGFMKFQLEKDNLPVEGFTYDDCDVFVGDEINHVITWHGKTTNELLGKNYRLSIKMNGARLFAVKGDFTVLDFNQSRLYDAYGFVSDRVGF